MWRYPLGLPTEMHAATSVCRTPGGGFMRKTPLYDEHCSRGAKMVEFKGWSMPIQFKGIVHEHLHTRSKVSLFDCSHMGEFRITGRQAIAKFSHLVISDALNIPVGRCRYGAMLNEAGGIVDDVIAFRLGEEELYVVNNAGPVEAVSGLIRAHCPDAEHLSAATAKIDVQGPGSRAALLDTGFSEARTLKYFNACWSEWEGHKILLSRTGYTGELGYELYLPTDLAPAMWQLLLELEDVEPAGLGARDTLRTEMGYDLSGQDVDGAVTPLEAGMDAFIAWDTDFIGKDALLAQRERGGYAVKAGIRTQDRRAPRPGFEVRLHGEIVGTVTSGTFGPSVGHGIGYARLPETLAEPGNKLTAGPKNITIETVDLPFYKNGTCRAKL